jgi:phage terminase large subunit
MTRKIIIKKENMNTHQRKWWELPNFIKLLVGGYGCGKTYIGALRSLYATSVNKGIPVQFVSPTYKLAKRTILITLFEILDRNKIPYSYNKSEFEFRFPLWDGILWIGSGDDPDSLKGPNLACAYIDEPFIQDREVYMQMNARVRHPKAKMLEIGMTGTPEQLNWGYELTFDHGVDIGVVIGSTRDNHALKPEFVKHLETIYTEEQAKAFIDGGFLNLTSGRVIPNFVRDKHLADDSIIDPLRAYYPLILGADFNVDQMTAEIILDANGIVYYVDEIRLPKNSTTFDLVRVAKERYPMIDKVYPDASGSQRRTSSRESDHQIFRNAGYKVVSPARNPDVKDRVNSFVSMIKQERIFVSPRCKELIKDLELMTWKNNDIDKSDVERTHAFDAGSYFVSYRYGIKTKTVTSYRI